MTLRSLNRAVIKTMGRDNYDRLVVPVLLARLHHANKSAVAEWTQPQKVFLSDSIMWLTGRTRQWVEETAAEYRASHDSWIHLSGLRSPDGRSDGVSKSMDVAEGFAAWALIKHLRPYVVVELGTRFGVSARLWKDALNLYSPNHRLYLCDLVDLRRYIGEDEAIFMQGDAIASLQNILQKERVDILFNDAHPYKLIGDSLELGIAHNVPCFAFHDVGGRKLRGGPYHAESASLTKEERLAHEFDFDAVGHWERHCMAEYFDERILYADAVETDKWLMQVFDSLFGLGVIMRQDKSQA